MFICPTQFQFYTKPKEKEKRKLGVIPGDLTIDSDVARPAGDAVQPGEAHTVVSPRLRWLGAVQADLACQGTVRSNLLNTSWC